MIDENGVMGVKKLDEDAIRKRLSDRIAKQFMQEDMSERTRQSIIGALSEEIMQMKMEGIVDPPFEPVVWFDQVNRSVCFEFRPRPRFPRQFQAKRIEVVKDIVSDLLDEFEDAVNAPERFALIFEGDDIHVEMVTTEPIQKIEVKGVIS